MDDAEHAQGGSAGEIEVTGEAFARRLANLLVERRRASGRSLRSLARASDGAFGVEDLRRLEDGRTPVSQAVVGAVALLYGADLGVILPARLPIEIVADGVIRTGGVEEPFVAGDPDSLLRSYLVLVRRLRAQERAPVIDLRRADVEVIAGYLGEPGMTVLDRLAALMSSTRVQRRAMGALLVAGALVVGLAGTAVAVTTGDDGPGSGAAGTASTGQPGEAPAGSPASTTASSATTATTATTATSAPPAGSAPSPTTSGAATTVPPATTVALVGPPAPPSSPTPPAPTTRPTTTSPRAGTTVPRPAATTTTTVLVAVGLPPVPPATTTGVAVGAPPTVPPPATTDAATGAPPVPTTATTSTTVDPTVPPPPSTAAETTTTSPATSTTSTTTLPEIDPGDLLGGLGG